MIPKGYRELEKGEVIQTTDFDAVRSYTTASYNGDYYKNINNWYKPPVETKEMNYSWAIGKPYAKDDVIVIRKIDKMKTKYTVPEGYRELNLDEPYQNGDISVRLSNGEKQTITWRCSVPYNSIQKSCFLTYRKIEEKPMKDNKTNTNEASPVLFAIECPNKYTWDIVIAEATRNNWKYMPNTVTWGNSNYSLGFNSTHKSCVGWNTSFGWFLDRNYTKVSLEKILELLNEKPIKVGDFVVITEGECNYEIGTVCEITKVNEQNLRLNNHGDTRFIASFHKVRKATTDEITKYKKNDIQIKGKPVIFGADYVEYEGNRLDKTALEEVAKVLSLKVRGYDTYVTKENLTIGCTTVSRADAIKVLEHMGIKIANEIPF